MEAVLHGNARALYRPRRIPSEPVDPETERAAPMNIPPPTIAPSGPTCAGRFRPGGPRPSWASSSTGAPTPSPPGPSRAAPWARCPSRTGSGTTRTPSGTATRSGSPAARRPSTTARSTGMRRTTTSSTPGPPNGSTRPRWAELFAAAGASYVIPTTKHHDGIALWDAPGHRHPQHRAPRTPPGPGPGDRGRGPGGRVCGSGSTTPAGWTGRSRDFPPHQTSSRGARPAAGGRGLQRVRAAARPRPDRAVRPDRSCGTTSTGPTPASAPGPGRCTSSSPTSTPAAPTGW